MRLLLVSSLLLSLKLFAVDAPKMAVGKGCPCLDCPYIVKGRTSGKWTARTDTKLFVKADGTGATIDVHKGEPLRALSGEVRNIPGELKVTFAHKNFKVGDKVHIIFEDSDTATWKLWYKGNEIFDDLSAMVGEKDRCKKPSAECWATVLSSMSAEWWVNLETTEKKVGWTKAIDDFEFNRSACQ